MPTEEEIKAIAREEWARLDREKTEAKQTACDHVRSGTLKYSEQYDEQVVVCDDCDKELRLNDEATVGKPGTVEQRGIDSMRSSR